MGTSSRSFIWRKFDSQARRDINLRIAGLLALVIFSVHAWQKYPQPLASYTALVFLVFVYLLIFRFIARSKKLGVRVSKPKVEVFHNYMNREILMEFWRDKSYSMLSQKDFRRVDQSEFFKTLAGAKYNWSGSDPKDVDWQEAHAQFVEDVATSETVAFRRSSSWGGSEEYYLLTSKFPEKT